MTIDDLNKLEDHVTQLGSEMNIKSYLTIKAELSKEKIRLRHSEEVNNRHVKPDNKFYTK